MTKVLITGGAGFIGSNLIAHLTTLGGYEISVIDNETLGSRDDIAEFDVEFIPGDIRDRDLVQKITKGVDTIVHLAADTRVMDSIEDPVFNFENNTLATFYLLVAARENGVRRVVNASTGGAILGEVPAPVHENIPPAPESPYGASKLAIEGYLSAFAGSYGMASASLRFSNIYGPRSYHKGSVVAFFFKRILAGEKLVIYGDGSQVRDYLFVEDQVEGIRNAIDSDVSGVFQLGRGKPTTINELLDAIRDVVGDEYPFEVDYQDFREGEIHTTWCDITKARENIGFNPTTELPEGLAKTFAWFLEQQSKQ